MSTDAHPHCESVAITCRGTTREGEYRAGETLLQTTLRFGIMPRYSCMSAECGACMALVTEGKAEMLENYALSDDELARGYVLTCQAVPLSARLAITYEE